MKEDHDSCNVRVLTCSGCWVVRGGVSLNKKVANRAQTVWLMLAEVLLGLLGHVACHVDTDNTHVGIIRLIKPTVHSLAD